MDPRLRGDDASRELIIRKRYETRDTMARIKVRTGMPSVRLTKDEFARRFRNRFFDPVFDGIEREIENLGQDKPLIYRQTIPSDAG